MTGMKKEQTVSRIIPLTIFIFGLMQAQPRMDAEDQAACLMASHLKNAKSVTVSIRTFLKENGEVWSRVGSGWVFQKEGLIVTRQSVVQGGDSIEVTFYNGQKLEARVLDCDPISQVALLKTDDMLKKKARFTCTEHVETGDCVILLGNSLGVFPSVTIGHVIGLQANGYLLFNGSVPAGNTGGPLFNRQGQLIGMLAGRCTVESQPEPVGVAVPFGQIREVLQKTLAFARQSYGWIGLCVIDIPQDDIGVRVINVIPDSPADKASIMKGDILIRMNGEAIQSASDLARRVKDMPKKQQVVFDAVQQNATRSYQVEVGCVPFKK